MEGNSGTFGFGGFCGGVGAPLEISPTLAHSLSVGQKAPMQMSAQPRKVSWAPQPFLLYFFNNRTFTLIYFDSLLGISF